MMCVERLGEPKEIHTGRDEEGSVKKVMFTNGTKKNKNKYKDMKNKAMIAVTKAMREKAEEGTTELKKWYQ